MEGKVYKLKSGKSVEIINKLESNSISTKNKYLASYQEGLEVNINIVERNSNKLHQIMT